MKSHYCKAERSFISYEGECNWCGEKEAPATDKQLVREFFSPLQHLRLVRFFQALHGLANWWRK